MSLILATKKCQTFKVLLNIALQQHFRSQQRLTIIFPTLRNAPNFTIKLSPVRSKLY